MKFCYVLLAIIAASSAYHGDKASPKAVHDTPLKNAALNARNSLDKGATKVRGMLHFSQLCACCVKLNHANAC
jgi:hypothetical protein